MVRDPLVHFVQSSWFCTLRDSLLLSSAEKGSDAVFHSVLHSMLILTWIFIHFGCAEAVFCTAVFWLSTRWCSVRIWYFSLMASATPLPPLRAQLDKPWHLAGIHQIFRWFWGTTFSDFPWYGRSFPGFIIAWFGSGHRTWGLSYLSCTWDSDHCVYKCTYILLYDFTASGRWQPTLGGIRFFHVWQAEPESQWASTSQLSRPTCGDHRWHYAHGEWASVPGWFCAACSPTTHAQPGYRSTILWVCSGSLAHYQGLYCSLIRGSLSASCCCHYTEAKQFTSRWSIAYRWGWPGLTCVARQWWPICSKWYPYHFSPLSTCLVEKRGCGVLSSLDWHNFPLVASH